METLTLLLMLWIGNNSSYDTTQMPAPAIIEMSARALTTEAYTDHPEKIPEGGIDERIYALYAFEDGPNGTIYILQAQLTDEHEAYSTPTDNPIFQERLLHELVHHVQRVSGVYQRIPCRKFSEKEAYLLGGKFLKEKRVEDPMPNRTFWAHMYSRC